MGVTGGGGGPHGGDRRRLAGQAGKKGIGQLRQAGDVKRAGRQLTCRCWGIAYLAGIYSSPRAASWGNRIGRERVLPMVIVLMLIALWLMSIAHLAVVLAALVLFTFAFFCCTFYC